MPESNDSVELFQALLNAESPPSEAGAARAMTRTGRETDWHRNQACGAVIARGAVACVLAGAVRKFALRSNGQRQIIDLIVAGDFFGFAPANPAYFLEAVSNETRIASFTREQIERLGADFPAVSALMRNRAADAISRLEHHLLVQGRITAREKVSAYLAAMTRRMKGTRKDTLILPVTRYDIADHLGIAVETVSRSMTALRRGGSIRLRTPRDVEIRDQSMLSAT